MREIVCIQVWERELGYRCGRERERKRETERLRQRDRGRETETERRECVREKVDTDVGGTERRNVCEREDTGVGERGDTGVGVREKETGVGERER